MFIALDLEGRVTLLCSVALFLEYEEVLSRQSLAAERERWMVEIVPGVRVSVGCDPVGIGLRQPLAIARRRPVVALAQQQQHWHTRRPGGAEAHGVATPRVKAHRRPEQAGRRVLCRGQHGAAAIRPAQQDSAAPGRPGLRPRPARRGPGVGPALPRGGNREARHAAAAAQAAAAEAVREDYGVAEFGQPRGPIGLTDRQAQRPPGRGQAGAPMQRDDGGPHRHTDGAHQQRSQHHALRAGNADLLRHGRLARGRGYTGGQNQERQPPHRDQSSPSDLTVAPRRQPSLHRGRPATKLRTRSSASRRAAWSVPTRARPLLFTV